MATDETRSAAATPPDDDGREGDSSGSTRRAFTVDIFGRRYKIESEHEPETIRALAKHVDRRMRQISKRAEPGDVVGAAVMAALNIADDYYRTRRALERREKQIAERARRLAERLDRAVESDE